MSVVRASFDVSTKEGKLKVFNAQNGASISLKNLGDGETININGVLQYNDTVDSYGKPQEVTITVLFGTDGNTYAGVSDTVAKAGDKLIDLLDDLQLESIDVAVIKQTSKGGNEFLNLRVAM